MSANMKRTYLMIGGTMLPAFAAVSAMAIITKSSINMKEAKYLAAFAVASCVGGYFTAKMLKDTQW